MRTDVRMNGQADDRYFSSITGLVRSHLEDLSKKHSVGPLKELFSVLDYDPLSEPISRRNWRREVEGALKEDPLIVAKGGDSVPIIYACLQSDNLARNDERDVIAQLSKRYPDSMFVFSNNSLEQWHFINVKSPNGNGQGPQFRRFTIGPDERLRTAADRLARIALTPLSQRSRMEIMKRHDQAFDVTAVTGEFFKLYQKLFEEISKEIRGLADPQQKHTFTQQLFNRLMFIAFVQKKRWLRLNGQSDYDYLKALWEDYQSQSKKRAKTTFYVDRLWWLFFKGLNTLNKGPDVERRIGGVPFLNGGLFEQGKHDLAPGLFIPDPCIEAILHELFEPFNFTVAESTPQDVEVAVDPEMLGQIFERLVTERHDTGSYYTPKPIVSFMCKEALKGYLSSQLPGESEDGIIRLIDKHDPAEIRNCEAALVALRRVKACDPACGSGAYLLDMMHELLDIQARLLDMYDPDPHWVYQQKLDIIQNNLYGVDVEESAVNIARLRLWLSLAVELAKDKRPEPLPNLDFKIEVGDSLLAPDPHGLQLRNAKVYAFQEMKRDYLKEHDQAKKERKRKAIEELRVEIALWTYGDTKPRAGFDWAVEFAEVFIDGGFHIVLSNPPYVRHERIKDKKTNLKEIYPAVYGTSDLYCYFYARALQLLRNEGMLAFISSNKWLRTGYGAKLRKLLSDTCSIQSITDFGDLPVFLKTSSYPMIVIAQEKRAIEQAPIYTRVTSLNSPYPHVQTLVKQHGQRLPPYALNGAEWQLFDADSSSQLRKMKAASIPLQEYVKGQIYSGIKTGCNDAFIIDDGKRWELIAQDARSAEIIKPLATGKDIRKWRTDAANQWLVVTPIGVDISRYPAIFAHFKQWQARLEKRGDKGRYWWELRSCAYYDAYEKPKIVFPDIAPEPRFAFDTKGTYLNNTAYMIPVADFYLLGVLNSSSVAEFCREQSTQARGGYSRFIYQYMEKVPIPNASTDDRRIIAALVQRCLDAQGVGCEQWEEEIDLFVAALYGL